VTGQGALNAIGWDVGGWNCDSNGNSRDALVILSAEGHQLGAPWRGNLRDVLNDAREASDFVKRLRQLCQLPEPVPPRIVLAIDAPLGLPAALIALHQGEAACMLPAMSGQNPYLFRLTERRLAEEGVTPLSAIKDMIGSQTSKAMHCVRRFAPQRLEPGVWGDAQRIEMIETYPALVRRRQGREKPIGTPAEIDIANAQLCAEIALAFAIRRDSLEPPVDELDPEEGWIWAPRRTHA
jgi:hypothetical protein